MKCDVCGKFAAYLDPEKEPKITLITPSSEFTEEVIEIVCWGCQQKELTTNSKEEE